MKRIFLLLLSLLLLTSCESISSTKKMVTAKNNSNTTSSSSNTSSSNETSSTTSKKNETTKPSTSSNKQNGKLRFKRGDSEEDQTEADFEISEGEELWICLVVDDVVITDDVDWYYTSTDAADVSSFKGYCIIKGIREGELTVVAKSKEHEAEGTIIVKSQKNYLIDYIKKNGYKSSSGDEYYFIEVDAINGVIYTYYLTYYEKTNKFEAYCKKLTSGSNLTITSYATITWSWGYYDQAEFKCTETLKYQSEGIEESTTVEFDNTCITFNAAYSC